MHLRKTILLGIFLLQYYSAGSQIINLNQYPKSELIFINKETAYLISNNLIELDSVLKPGPQSRFQQMGNGEMLFKGYDAHYFWYRFVVRNNDSMEKRFVLLYAGLGVRKAEVWQGTNNTWTLAGTSGYSYQFSQRAYKYVHISFPLTVPKMSQDTFLVKIDESHCYKVMGFVITTPGKMQYIEHHFYFYMGIITGLLLLFAIFNLYLFIFIKEKIHFWYFLYIIFMLFFVLKQEGLDAEFLGLDSFNGYRSTYMASVAILAIGFLLQMVQLFLDNIKGNFFYKVLIFLKWSSFIGAVVQLVIFIIQPSNEIESFVFQWFNKTTVASLGIVLILCIKSYLKGFKPALFLLVSQLIFIIGAVSRTLFLKSQGFIFPPSLFEIGLVIEVIIISFGLMYKYNLYKSEKEKLGKMLKLQEVEFAQQVLTVQEQEQKRISRDLHDELGGNLAALKMTLESYKLPSQQAGTLTTLIDKTSANVRQIAHDLMPPEFESTNLSELLDKFYQRLSTEGKINFLYHHSPVLAKFNKQQELMIYRIIMELTNNIVKHSHAAEATIQLLYHEDYLTLVIEDNGTGIRDKESSGMGLKNIRSRINYLNGDVKVDSGENGTTIMIKIPY